MPEWLQIASLVAGIFAAVVSPLWVISQSKKVSRDAAVTQEARLVTIEKKVDELAKDIRKNDERAQESIDDHEARIRHIEISHAANHGAALKEVAHA